MSSAVIGLALLVISYGTLLVVVTWGFVFMRQANAVISWLGDVFHLVPPIRVTKALFLLPDRMPDAMETFDATHSFKTFLQTIRSTTGQHVMRVEDVLCRGPESSRETESFLQRVSMGGKKDMCLGITYSVLMSPFFTLPRRDVHMVFYRIIGTRDPFVFPPYPVAIMTTPHEHRSQDQVVRATLCLQHFVESRLNKQFSFPVTSKIVSLGGPKHNFYVDSTTGGHLEPTVLFGALHEEVTRLLDHAKDQLQLNRLEPGPTPVHYKSANARQVLALRVRMLYANGSTRVIDLDRFLPV
jgi:hypothetical protein